jgi:hypothetical protein
MHVKPWYKDWSEEDIALLKEVFDFLSYEEMMELFDASEDQIKRLCRRIGLKREGGGGRKSTWPDWAQQFLLDNYQVMGDLELSRVFTSLDKTGKKWTFKMVERRRTHLGITRTDDQIRAIKERNRIAGCWNTPHLQEMRHKKGKAQGEIVLWHQQGRMSYLRVKVGEKMLFLQHFLWEAKHGPIPEGMILRCKGSNRLDPMPENWEIVTRAEHARRNNKPFPDHPELQDLYQVQRKLKMNITRKINSK